MAKQYEKKPIKSQQSRGLSALWLGFVTFVFGYLAASWLDVNQFGHWVNSVAHPVPAQDTAQLEADASIPPRPKLEFYTLLTNEPAPKVNGENKPTQVSLQKNIPVADVALSDANQMTQPLDLEVRPATTNIDSTTRVATGSKESPRPAMPPRSPEPPRPFAVATPAKSEGAYSIQVGSFRAYHEAQRMKAQLIMKGFSAEIATVMQQDTNWYRVIIGPFASLTQAQQAQQSFARREHITGMIRKLT